MQRDFNLWLSTFRESIADYKYYVDFETVYKNIKLVKRPLELLNTIVGSEKIEEDLWVLYSHYPEIVEAIPLLLAKRERQIYRSIERLAAFSRSKGTYRTSALFSSFVAV